MFDTSVKERKTDRRIFETASQHVTPLSGASSQDLQALNIETCHRNAIWRALVEYRTANNIQPPSSSNECRSQRGATVVGKMESVEVAMAAAGNHQQGTSLSGTSITTEPVTETIFQSDYYEVSRTTFRHTYIPKGQDHNYCYDNKTGPETK